MALLSHVPSSMILGNLWICGDQNFLSNYNKLSIEPKYGHWLFAKPLHFIIFTCQDISEKQLFKLFQQFGGRARGKHFFMRIKGNHGLHEAWNIRRLNPFNSFLHVFRKKKGHKILGLMLDLKFKFHLVSNNLGCDRATIWVPNMMNCYSSLY
jgi:hypothetical protein